MVIYYQVRRELSDYLIPKHYAYYSYFIREYHFHFLRLGISGWGIWVFLWECGCMGLRLGFFYMGFPMGLLVGLGVGILVRLGLRYRFPWCWVFGWVFLSVLPMGLSVC